MSNGNRTPCPHLDDVAAYVLGAHDDSGTFMDHAATCEECRAELARLAPVAAALPAAAPPEPMPPQLRARLMEQVAAEAQVLVAAGPGADRAERSRRTPRLAFAGAVAFAVVVALAVALLTGGSGSNARTTYASVAPAAAGARAVLRESGGHAMLQVSGMPQAPPGKVYEVWLASPNGQPQPTDALFGVTRDGRGAVAIPGSLGHVQTVMVTSEPDGGSPHPTSSPLLTFHLS